MKDRKELSVGFNEHYVLKDTKVLNYYVDLFQKSERILTENIPKYTQVFSVVLANLKKTELYNYVYIQLDNNIKYNNVGARIYKKVLKFLESKGLINYQNGTIGCLEDGIKREATKLTAYKAILKQVKLKKLKNTRKSYIVLKDSDKKKTIIKPFRLPENVKERNKTLIEYNKLISDTIFTLDGEEIVEYQPNIRAIYNNRSFEQSGRFFGGFWQQLSGKERLRIQINGNSIAGYDLRNALIQMAIDKHNLEDTTAKLSKQEDYYDIPNTERKIVKKLINIMLNKKAKSGIIEAYFKNGNKKVDFIDERQKIEVERTLKLILLKYKCLFDKGFFFTGYGMQLMNFESNIAEAVIRHFTYKDIPVLTIHDSYLVEEQYLSELEEVVISAYKEMFGVVPELNPEGHKLSNI